MKAFSLFGFILPFYHTIIVGTNIQLGLMPTILKKWASLAPSRRENFVVIFLSGRGDSPRSITLRVNYGVKTQFIIFGALGISPRTKSFGILGFEPRLNAPKALVLPLHYIPDIWCGAGPVNVLPKHAYCRYTTLR